MEENTENNTGVEQTPQTQGGRYTEMDLVFVLIMIGLLGIGLSFLFVFFDLDKKIIDKVGIVTTNQVEEVSNEEQNSTNYSDVQNRNKDILGLSIGKKGRFYSHPKTDMAFYINPTGECLGECLENWTPYMAPSGKVKDSILGVIVRTDDRTNQYSLRGNGLYTYNNDYIPGDTNGDKFDGVWEIARP